MIDYLLSRPEVIGLGVFLLLAVAGVLAKRTKTTLDDELVAVLEDVYDEYKDKERKTK